MGGFAAAAAADAASSIFGTILNASSAKNARIEEDRRARSAHQIEVADLERAGLNPVLSAGGQGAPYSFGPTASGNVRTNFTGAYADKKRLDIEQRLAESNMALIAANTAASQAQARRTNIEADASLLSNPLLREQLITSTRAAGARADLDAADLHKRKALLPLWDLGGAAINNILQYLPGVAQWAGERANDVRLFGRKKSTVSNSRPSTIVLDGKTYHLQSDGNYR